MVPPGPRPDPVALLLFAACVLLGSGNFLAVRFSNLELPPLWGAGLRFALAAAAFTVIALVARRPRPRGELLRRTLVFGLLNFGVFYALMYWALVHVTAGVATIVLASVPLLTLLLATAQRLERLRARALIGAFAAVLGIGWMAYAPGELVLPPLPLLALVAAGLSIGQSIILGKHISANHPAITNAVAMATGSVHPRGHPAARGGAGRRAGHGLRRDRRGHRHGGRLVRSAGARGRVAPRHRTRLIRGRDGAAPGRPRAAAPCRCRTRSAAALGDPPPPRPPCG